MAATAQQTLEKFLEIKKELEKNGIRINNVTIKVENEERINASFVEGVTKDEPRLVIEADGTNHNSLTE